jgi:hypothetical protein
MESAGVIFSRGGGDIPVYPASPRQDWLPDRRTPSGISNQKAARITKRSQTAQKMLNLG